MSCLCGAPQAMWLSTMISVGRSRVLWKVRKARANISWSLASPTRVTFQPYAMNRVATSSVNASAVAPSMVIRLLS